MKNKVIFQIISILLICNLSCTQPVKKETPSTRPSWPQKKPSQNASPEEWRKYLDEFSAVLKYDLSQPWMANISGKSKLENGDIQGAIIDLTRYIENNTWEKESSYYWRGKAYTLSNQNWKAWSDFSSAIEINPLNSQYYIDRANVKSKIWMMKRSACEDLYKAKILGDTSAIRLIKKLCY